MVSASLCSGQEGPFFIYSCSIPFLVYGLFYSWFFYFHKIHLLQLYLLSAVKDVLIDVALLWAWRVLCNEGKDVGRTQGGKMSISSPGLRSSGRCCVVALYKLLALHWHLMTICWRIHEVRYANQTDRLTCTDSIKYGNSPGFCLSSSLLSVEAIYLLSMHQPDLILVSFLPWVSRKNV